MIYRQWLDENAEELIREVLDYTLKGRDTPHYRMIPASSVTERIRTAIHDGFARLDTWLSNSPGDETLFESYRSLGRERSREGVPLKEVVRIFMLINAKIEEQIQADKLFDPRYSLDELRELHQQTVRFFNKVVQAIIQGYEETHRDRR